MDFKGGPPVINGQTISAGVLQRVYVYIRTYRCIVLLLLLLLYVGIRLNKDLAAAYNIPYIIII